MHQHHTAIRIPTPCHEPWATMTPTSGGRHCASCDKTVVDFTRMTDAQVLAYFKQLDRSKTCGLFKAEQLNRPLITSSPTTSSKLWQLWLAGLLAMALTTPGCHSSLGEPQPVAVDKQAQPPIDSVSVMAPPASTFIFIEGHVLDASSGLPVAGTVVTLNATIRAFSDASGHFSLRGDPRIDGTETLILRLESPGYSPSTQVVFPAPPPPTNGLLAVLSTFPLPSMILGDVEELHLSVK